jgi:hypothetical protein
MADMAAAVETATRTRSICPENGNEHQQQSAVLPPPASSDSAAAIPPTKIDENMKFALAMAIIKSRKDTSLEINHWKKKVRILTGTSR